MSEFHPSMVLMEGKVLADFEANGYAVVPDVLDVASIETLRGVLSSVESGASRRESIFAIRNLLDVPAIHDLASSEAVRGLMEPILGANCFAVRALFFDKTPDANWKVVWHQDLSIALQEQKSVEGFGPWSEKEGVTHVQPPTKVLENMATVRLHLDPCHRENGALKVVPKSQRSGKLNAREIGNWRRENAEVIVEVEQGGALLMRPLLLHASSPSLVPDHRRVVHLEFAGVELPAGLEWKWRV